MTTEDIVRAVTGGLLAGSAAGALLLLEGRIAGVSGILGGVIRPRRGDVGWRVLFLLGLAAGGLALARFDREALPHGTVAPLATLLGAGLLVGFGARLGGGCTSGHGVAGTGRLAVRSIVATLVFMAAGVVTVWVVRQALAAS